MKCNEVQEMLPVYWDLSDSDARRIMVDHHVQHCEDCREEYQIWQESTELIRRSRDDMTGSDAGAISISGKVMERIYENEAWRIPIPNRLYAISYKMRRNCTAVIAFCLALFMFGFLFSLVYNDASHKDASAESISFGLQPVASVHAEGSTSIKNVNLVASLTPQDPFMLKVGPIQTYPDYLLALSLLGLVSTLLIMNWLSRTKI